MRKSIWIFVKGNFPLCGLVEKKSSGFVCFESKQWWYENQLHFFKWSPKLSYLSWGMLITWTSADSGFGQRVTIRNYTLENKHRIWKWPEKQIPFFLKPAYSGSCPTCSFSGCQVVPLVSLTLKTSYDLPVVRWYPTPATVGGSSMSIWQVVSFYMVFQDLKTDASYHIYHDLIETLSVHDLKICSFNMLEPDLTNWY